jgi:hypothetical protein
MSAFWWGAYSHRHQALGIAGGSTPHRGQRSIIQRARDIAGTSATALRGVRTVKSAFSGSGDRLESRRRRAEAGTHWARERAKEQVGRSIESEHRAAGARVGPQADTQISEKRAQLDRLKSARARAQEAGEERRAAELAHREQRVAGEIARDQEALNGARRATEDGERARRSTGRVYTRAQGDARERFLDAQAALPAGLGVGAAHGADRRDYAALAGLAGYGSEEYRRLEPRLQRAARLDVDRELAMRTEVKRAARDMAAGAPEVLGWRERRRAEREFDDALGGRMREGGHRLPSSQAADAGLDAWRRSGRAEAGESSVMRDAREVAARRKRQLGRDHT